MATTVCLTVDVEDWYEGMAVLGCKIDRAKANGSGLDELARSLASRSAAVTLFVVGNYARAASKQLASFAANGHEIASHGPDHGRLPSDERKLRFWLRSGREMVEDVVQRPVLGFRAPRFEIPVGMELPAFRLAIADAGFSYVSDLNLLGNGTLHELPVLQWHGVPVGGGSYQRLLPARSVRAITSRHDRTAVLYYHSYDFGDELPGTRDIRSAATAAQVLGRSRIPTVFNSLLDASGSVTCEKALVNG